MDEIRALQLRLAAAERRLSFYGVTLLTLLAALAAYWVLSWTRPRSSSPNILRVHQLIVEDENGRPRIVLGAPVAEVPGRRRQDPALGLVILGADGADRVQVAAPLPGPQMRGVVNGRVSPVAGLVFNGPDGNERGGLGVQDDGTAAFGLDHENGREAVHLAVAPRAGFSGLLIHGEDGSLEDRSILGVTKDGKTVLKMADPSGHDRVTLSVTQDANRFMIESPGGKQSTDMLKGK